MINTLRISGTAVDVADTDLEVETYTTEVGDAGSFPPHSSPLAVRVTIFARPAGMTPLESAQTGSSVAISNDEAEAWLRVCVGDDLADYAYHVPALTSTTRKSRKPQRLHKHLFVSFIDRHGNHILAPDNFQWHRIYLASGQPPRKLTPHNDNTELRHRVATTGPFTDAEADRDLRTNHDGTWRIQLTGDHLEDCTPVARAAIEAAYQLFRVRGAIHTQLRPERIIATPNDLQLHFRWNRNVNTFAITTTLPQTEQQFHSPATDPSRWMYHVARDWDEELSTGWVRWAQRTRINGVVHLGVRQEQPRGEYSPGGRLQPRVDRDGLISIPHGHELAMDITTTYAAKKLIAWHHERDIRITPFVFAAHAVIAWTDTAGLARLDILEGLPTTPPFSLRRAAFHAIHDAADAGAHHITTTIDNPVLTDLGFTPHTNGQRALDIATMP